MSEPGGAIGKNPEHRHSAAWQESLAALPSTTFDAGETVVRQGTKSGRLLILKNGAVSVVKNGIEIATVAEPGAVFGELSVLLDEPHTADVRTIKRSEFHVADANMLLTREPAALLYVAKLLARRSRSRQPRSHRNQKRACGRRAAEPDPLDTWQDRVASLFHRRRLHQHRSDAFDPMTASVQVFGRRHGETIDALMRPATEKRQGTKSRWVMQRRCRGRYGDLAGGTALIILD